MMDDQTENLHKHPFLQMEKHKQVLRFKSMDLEFFWNDHGVYFSKSWYMS